MLKSADRPRPLRISLAGGGTDLPAYYEQFGGAVVSTTLNKYFYVFLPVLEKECLQITSSADMWNARLSIGQPDDWTGPQATVALACHRCGVESSLT